jgi:hypothetical protein
MKRLLLSLIGAALIAVGLTATASASTIVNPIFNPQLHVGDHAINPQIDAGVYTAGHKFGGHTNFTDTISFSITSATNLVLKVLTWGNITVNATLKDVGTNAVLQSFSIGTGTLRGHSGTLVTELLSLTKITGTWVLTLTGTACSCAGYVVALSSAVTPIPAALVMFLTSLAGLGFFGWRRRSTGVA